MCAAVRSRRCGGFEVQQLEGFEVKCPHCDGTLALERDEYGIEIVCVQGAHRWYEARAVRGGRAVVDDEPMEHLPRVSKQHRGDF